MISGRIALAKRYLSHRLNAVDQHSLHAPFIYDFYTTVVKNKIGNQQLDAVLDQRKKLLQNRSIITVTDFGTGKAKSEKRVVCNLAKTSNQPKVSRLLFNIARRYQPQIIVELGTSLGLTTLQLAAASPDSKIITFEGCPNLSEIAQRNFHELGQEQIQVITGPLETTLDPYISTLDGIDLLFIDANHKYGSTLAYFEKCLPKMHSNSIVVMDDIHWSESMEQAWKQIKGYDQVSLTADLFKAGVVFFDKSLTQSHYILEF